MDKKYSLLRWEREGAIGILHFNRAEALNALSADLQEELLDLLPRLNLMEDLHAVIITGEGKAFSAGGDLDGFLARSTAHAERGGVRALFRNRVPRALLAVEIPLIAAINGPAVGGGLTLSLTCNLRIASEEARFGATFARVGLTPEYGSSFLLARVVGLTRASEMILTARIIDAQEALSFGLVSEVLPPDRLLARARELAEQIAALPPVAIRMCKRVLHHGMDCTLSQALDYEELVETHCFSSLDHREAVTAFLEKRQPHFLGR